MDMLLQNLFMALTLGQIKLNFDLEEIIMIVRSNTNYFEYTPQQVRRYFAKCRSSFFLGRHGAPLENAENTNCRGKNHCPTGLQFDWFTLNSFST